MTTAPTNEMLAEALTQAFEYFDNRSDVVDGDYGVPEPNLEMRLAQMCEEALSNLDAAAPAAGGDDLPKRPFAFAVRRAPDNGADQWRLFMDEGEARAEAEQLDGDYEALFRVGDRRSAIAALQAPAHSDAVREALLEALRGLEYIAPAIPVLRTMFMTADLKLGAAKAAEMDVSNKEAIEKLKAVLSAITAQAAKAGDNS